MLIKTAELAKAKGVSPSTVRTSTFFKRVRPAKKSCGYHDQNQFTEEEAVRFLFQRREIRFGKILVSWSASWGAPLYILKEDRAIYCDRKLYESYTGEWTLVKVLPDDVDIQEFIQDLKTKGNIVL